MIRTYAVGRSNSVVRRDNHTGAWNILAPFGDLNTIWNDVQTDRYNSSKVFIVGKCEIDNVNHSLQYSTDAGLTWNTPTGNWIACDTFYDIWVVNQSVIWAVGSDGQVVISLNGGLSFNLTNAKPGLNAPGDIFYTSGIHALSEDVAIVLGSPGSGVTQTECYAWKTIDGGSTWTMLNGGTTLQWNITIPPGYTYIHVGNSNNIWISPDQVRIVLATGYGQYLSTDSGATFTAVENVFYRSGIHMTWFPDYSPTPSDFRHFGGVTFQLTHSTDLGVSFPVERYYDGVTNIPAGNPLATIRGAHFYEATNGYYTIDDEIFTTTDGGVTGTLSYTNTVNAFYEAVWTGEDAPTYYQIVDCSDDQNVICVTNDLSQEVSDGVSFYIEGYPNVCFHAEGLFDPCTSPIGINILTTVQGGCDNCPTITCYELRDCTGTLPSIYTSTDLFNNIGSIISLKDSTGHESPECWQVFPATPGDCNAEDVVEIYKCYATCVDCLPVPVPLCPPKPRAVTPNYVTGLCDPEVAEKAMCNFAEMMYRDMMNHRFKLTNCCPKDDVSIIIQKEKVAFRLTQVEDPNIVPCEPTLIYNLYSLTRLLGDLESTITYFSSLGMIETIIVPACTSRICESVSFCAAYGSIAIDTLPVVAVGEACPTVTPCVINQNLVYLGPCTA